MPLQPVTPLTARTVTAPVAFHSLLSGQNHIPSRAGDTPQHDQERSGTLLGNISTPLIILK